MTNLKPVVSDSLSQPRFAASDQWQWCPPSAPRRNRRRRRPISRVRSKPGFCGGMKRRRRKNSKREIRHSCRRQEATAGLAADGQPRRRRRDADDTCESHEIPSRVIWRFGPSVLVCCSNECVTSLSSHRRHRSLVSLLLHSCRFLRLRHKHIRLKNQTEKSNPTEQNSFHEQARRVFISTRLCCLCCTFLD